MSEKRYKIIYADPPWNYDDKSKNRGGAARHYETMTVHDLKALKVADICGDDCILFLWATFPNLPAAMELIKAWGFEFKTIGFNWVKKNKVSDSWFWGMGNWTRSNSEICLIGVRGKPKRIGKGVHSVIDERISKHSKKPIIVRDKIVELMGDLPRLEMFAREAGEGWDIFGDEVESDIIIPSADIPKRKPIVILESPYAGDIDLNVRYARFAMNDSLYRGEAPYASHLLYTQDGVLSDEIPDDRRLGMEAGFSFSSLAEAAVVYTNLGISPGMARGIEIHRSNGLKIITRNLKTWSS